MGRNRAVGNRLRAGGTQQGFAVPADQSIFTKSVANTVTTYRPTEAFADGVSIGSTSGTPASLSYTPGAVDLDVDLTMTGSTQTLKLAVADVTNVSATLTGWTRNGVSAPSAVTDYAGGTTAWRLQSSSSSSVQHYITTTPSPVNANTKTCIEFVAKAGPTLPKVMVLFSTAGGNHIAILDFTTGKQSSTSKTYIFPVQDLGGGWFRFWAGVIDAQTATAVFIYLTNTFDMLNAATCTLTTSDYIDVSGVRMVDGQLPFYTRQKSGWWRNGSTADGAERWTLTSEFNTSAAEMGFTANMFLDVLKPDSYSDGTQYRVVYLMPVEATVASFNNELTIIKALNLHNTMNCLFVRPTFASGGNRTWGGKKSDGTIDHDSYISVMLPAFMRTMYSVMDSRDGRTIMGYSAGGFAALTQMNRSPTVWGYCVAWDCPVSQVYAFSDIAAHFGSSGQYDAYNPRLTFSAASWNDKCRLVLGGSAVFEADTQAMFTVVQSALGNPKNNGGTDYATTITDASGKWWKLYKNQTGIGAAAHNFLAEWVTPGMAALAALWVA